MKSDKSKPLKKGHSKISKHGTLKKTSKIHKKGADVEKKFKCRVCGQSFVRKEHLKGHSRVHTGERPYKCDVCGKSFRNCSNLKEHRRTHTGERPYDCKICFLTFLQSNHVKKHMRIHAKEAKECNSCSEKFKTNEELKKHIKDIHRLDETEVIETEELYQCSFCPQVFKYRHQFETHSKLHSGGNCLRCEICGNGFSTLSDLDKHKLSHKEEKVPALNFQCHICAEYFERYVSLELHLQKHEKKNHFRCEICSRAFTRKDNLKKHYVIHKSANEDDLPMQSIPKDLKSLVIKNEKLALRKELKKSLRVVKDDEEEEEAFQVKIKSPVKRETFQCEYCDRCFTVERIWLKHMKRHLDRIPGKKRHVKQVSDSIKNSKHQKIDKNHEELIEETQNGKAHKRSLEIDMSSKLKVNVDNEKVREVIGNTSKHKVNERNSDSLEDEAFIPQEEIQNAQCSKVFKEDSNASTATVHKKSCKASKSKEIGKIDKKSLKINVQNALKGTHFICQVCERSFSFKHHFLSHMRVHSGGTPDFSCKVCGKCFKKVSTLNKHRGTHLRRRSKLESP